MLKFKNNNSEYTITVNGLDGYYRRDIERFLGDLTDDMIGIHKSMITNIEQVSNDVVEISGSVANEDEAERVFETTLGFAKMHNISPFTRLDWAV